MKPKFSPAARMIAKCFKQDGYQEGRGLGANLQGDPEPLNLPGQLHTAGLGYNGQRRQRREETKLTFPPLSHNFTKPHSQPTTLPNPSNTPATHSLSDMSQPTSHQTNAYTEPPRSLETSRTPLIAKHQSLAQDQPVLQTAQPTTNPNLKPTLKTIPEDQPLALAVEILEDFPECSIAGLFEEEACMISQDNPSTSSPSLSDTIYPNPGGITLSNWTCEPIVQACKFRKPRVKCEASNDAIPKIPALVDLADQTYDEIMSAEEEGGPEPQWIQESAERHENRSLPNIEETESINLGTSTCLKEVKIGRGPDKVQRWEMIELLKAYQDVFA